MIGAAEQGASDIATQTAKIGSGLQEKYNPIKANSSVYTDSTGRYLVEGHHTTVAATILEKGSGPNMNTPTNQLPSATNIHWTKRWYEFWKKAIKVVD